MRWPDLDLDHGVLWVRKSKTPNGRREIPLHPLVLESLREWKHHGKSEWVFPGAKKSGTHLQDFGRGFAAAARKAGLPQVTPGCLRHTSLTWLEKADYRRSVRRELGGHTRDRHADPYLHPERQDKVDTIGRLPLPAKFTTVPKPSGPEAGSNEEQAQVPQELVMVGPWGLEPQTSTVSR
jgi:integrase